MSARLKRWIRNHAYALIAALWTAGAGGVLFFALYAGVRHLLWFEEMRPHGLPPLWLWLSVAVPGAAALAFWYRLTEGLLWRARRNAEIERRLGGRTEALPAPEIPPAAWDKAVWRLSPARDRFAFTWGFLHPRVTISRGLWDELGSRERLALIHHEGFHVEAHDALQQQILEIFERAFPFPFARELSRKYLVQREIAADAAAVRAFSGDPTHLASALLTAVRGKRGAGNAAVGGRPRMLAGQAVDASRTVAAGAVSGPVPGAGLSGAFEERVQVLQSGAYPAWWDGRLTRKVIPTVMALAVTVGQGILVWCR